MTVPTENEPPKFDKIPTPKPLPDVLNIEKNSNNNHFFANTIKKLQLILNDLQNPSYKDILIRNIYFFGFKLGQNKQQLEQKIFNQMEYEFNEKQAKSLQPANQIDMLRNYNYAVELFENLENEKTELQMAIEFLSNKQ
jgi:hypothetical protein